MNIPHSAAERVLVKICTNTSVEDARLAEDTGADYVGIIVEHPPSPRNVSLEQARIIAAALRKPVVAVTVNLPLQRLLEVHAMLRPAVLQLHGDESPEVVHALMERGISTWAVIAGESKAVIHRAQEMVATGAEAIMVDARAVSEGGVVYGGTGEHSDWATARRLVEMGVRTVLAGGLTPDNVAEAIETVRPWMVDVASGVEARKGVKDPEKVRRFIEAVRAMEND